MARTGRLADAVAHDYLEDLATRTTHIGLGSDDPFAVMDPLTVEPVGGVYHRAAVVLHRVSLLLRNTGELAWTGLPVGAVIAWYIGWDAPSNGNVTFACPSPDLVFPAGGGFAVPADGFFFGINA